MKIRKNDKVKVMIGKDKGKEAVVEKVLVKQDRVYVQGVNVYKKHVKGKGINELIKAIQASNVMVICPKCSKPTRVGIKIEKNKKLRFCKKCQAEL